MSKETEERLNKIHKTFDFVESKKGSWGYIKEVNINNWQSSFNKQVSYSVNWIKNVDKEHNEWWHHNDLIVLGNMFKEIDKCIAHPFGKNKDIINKMM